MKKTKNLLAIVAMMLLVAMVSVAGTVAYLTAKTSPVENTFTVGNINIDLKEHDYIPKTDGTGTLDTDTEVVEEKDYKMVPGNTMPKDPFLRVNANSENCWIFVEVVESTTPVLATYIDYAVADTWTELSGVTGPNGGKVYRYKEEVKLNADAQTFDILAGNKVTVKNVDKAAMDALEVEGATLPTLTFYGYACQSANVSAENAWGTITAAN